MTVYFQCKQDCYLRLHKEAGQIIIPPIGRLPFIHPPYRSIAAICGQSRGSAPLPPSLCVCVFALIFSCVNVDIFPVLQMHTMIASSHGCIYIYIYGCTVLMEPFLLGNLVSQYVCVVYPYKSQYLSVALLLLQLQLTLFNLASELKTCCRP